MPARKKLAVAIAIIAAILLLTQPSYHSGKAIAAGNGTVNYTSDDYYVQYYGANSTGEFTESWLEFRNPADAFNYYCENRTVLQVGVFIVGTLGEENINAQGNWTGNSSAAGGVDALGGGDTLNSSSADGIDAGWQSQPVCYGIKTSLPQLAELAEERWQACYGFRLGERSGCMQGL